ncbi:TRAP transporter small permease [Undibacter mobilis]|uniref:TRAP transporter small permease protein n=1 Tax=Undibacter mobilis TaxID=2292256 RepID=A0A371BAX1_9BRAD|nr:TRAP transporter small permease [Undibacter mobilis]RDV04511.1 TRAP transporter small permease [Undibacter mobilis]
MQASDRGPLLAALDTADKIVRLACKWAVFSTGTVLLVAITIGVISRYVITVGGVDWAEELPKQLFAWFIMFGVVLAVQTGNHIAVDLALHALPERGKRLVMVLTSAIVVFAYAYLALTALEVADIAKFEINPVLGTPGSLPYFALALGAILTALTTMTIAIRIGLLGSAAAPQARPEDSVQ